MKQNICVHINEALYYFRRENIFSLNKNTVRTADGIDHWLDKETPADSLNPRPFWAKKVD
jgi:hypothetical protein